MNDVRRAALVIPLVAAMILESGFAAEPDVAAYRIALPGYRFEFPRDHGAHDDFRTEWWYYTGHLRSASGRRYGFELTFFRVGAGGQRGQVESAWDLRNLSLAHFAISDAGKREFRYYEKMNRASPYLADARPGFLHVFNEGWSATTSPDGSYRLVARAGDDAIDLRLRQAKPPAIHGEDGISVKAAGEGHASHYYSLTRLEAEGTIRTARGTEACSGLAWMDHEFGSSMLREYQSGWDWFSVQLDNRTELMLYRIRRNDGTPDEPSSGSIILEDGSVIHLSRPQFVAESLGRWKSPKSGATYPMGWRIRVPAFGIDLMLRETFKDQELITSRSTQVTYWEGAVEVTGRSGGTLVRGQGYVEMTGYDRPLSR